MATHPPAKISSKEVKQILRDSNCQPDPSIAVGKGAYRLPDGRVLVIVDRGRGVIWNRDELLSLMGQRKPGGTHVLADRIPDARAFITDIPSLVGRLAADLGIPADQLDFSDDSLKQIDQKVFKEVGREHFLTSARFPHLVAYIGEYIRRRTGPFSKWDSRLSQDGRVWEPWVVDANGNAYNPFILVYEELHECDTPQSFEVSAKHARPN